MQKLALFDIDYTIFNTNLYRKKLFENLAHVLECQVDDFSEIGKNVYKKLRQTTPYLTPSLFLEAILDITNKPNKLKDAQTVFWDKGLYESCIYPDVKQTFSYLTDNNVQIGIFSTGNLEHQKIKVESLKEYLIDNHTYISLDKLEIIKNTFNASSSHQTFLIDDYPQVLENAKEHNNKVIIIYINREDGHPDTVLPNNFKPDATITNLELLIDIINSYK